MFVASGGTARARCMTNICTPVDIPSFCIMHRAHLEGGPNTGQTRMMMMMTMTTMMMMTMMMTMMIVSKHHVTV
jgi:hypothetical protein